MRLGELLDVPRLRLRLISGPGALDRLIRRVYTTDLPDPGRYLAGGELVLTGGVWHHGPQDAETFVASLSSRRVAALGVGLAAFGSMPDDIVAACERHRLPLLEVPEEISFADVADAAAARLHPERGGLSDARRWVSAAESGASGLLAVVAAELDMECCVLSATGRVLAGAGPVTELRDLRHRVVQARRLPAVIEGANRTAISVFPLGNSPTERSPHGYLACPDDHRRWSADRREAIEQVAGLLALPRVRLNERQLVRASAAGDLIELVTGGGAGADEIARRLAGLGLDPAARLIALRARVTGTGADAAWATCALEEATAWAAGAVVAQVAGDAIALAPLGGPGVRGTDEPGGPGELHGPGGPGGPGEFGEPDAVAAVAAAGRWLEPVVGTGRVEIGVSGAAHGAGLGRALAEAGHARQLAELRDGRVNVVSSNEIDSHVPLLALVPDAARAAFRERVLGPVVRYDETHRSDLIHTLEAWLDASGSWQTCAERLHLHVNTLRYRIQCVERLTGRDLSSLADRVDFVLALRAR